MLPADATHADGHESADSAAMVVFDRVSVAFDDQKVLRDLSFTVPRGSMRIMLGASGAGKSVVLKLILGLIRPDSGRIYVHGQRIDTMPERDLLRLRADVGMSFQEIALFDSLTVAENVGYRLSEETDMPDADVERRVSEVLAFMGLSEHGLRLPSELSGGQRRRVAIARAMAAKPSLLLLDDPTTGLDPIIATTVDDEIVKLRDLERVTGIVVTHQIRDAYYVANHRAVRTNGDIRIVEGSDGQDNATDFLVLYEGRIHFEGSASDLLATKDRYVRELMEMTLPPW